MNCRANDSPFVAIYRVYNKKKISLLLPRSNPLFQGSVYLELLVFLVAVETVVKTFEVDAPGQMATADW